MARTESVPIPPEDTSFDMEMTYIKSRTNRVRLDCRGVTWSGEKGEYVTQEVKDVFDGELRRTFFPLSNAPYPNVHFQTGEPSAVANDLRVRAIQLALQPFDDTVRVFEAHKLQLSDEEFVVRGHPCIILRHSDGEFSDAIFADPSRAFVPTRVTTARLPGPWGGRVCRQVDISYTEDAQHGWIPTEWNISRFDEHGDLIESWSGTVTEYMINELIADSTFRFDYPPGTWVSDYVNDKRYILKEGGEKRPILRGEFTGDNFEQLLATDPPKSSRDLHWVLALGIPIAVTVFMCWLRRRAR